MSQARLDDALARLHEFYDLRLPLKGRDLLGRLALRVLWRRHLKWQVEMNIATRDAVDSLRELVHEPPAVAAPTREVDPEEVKWLVIGLDDVRRELDALRRADQTLTRVLTQRVSVAAAAVRSDLAESQLQAAEGAERVERLGARLEALESRLAEVVSGIADVRYRQAVGAVAAPSSAATPGSAAGDPRWSMLESTLGDLVDGPYDLVRERRAAYLDTVGDGPVLDLAPGRGEWLAVLRSAGTPASAVTTNARTAEWLARDGHDVALRDPASALAATGRGSLGGVTAFRYVERLEPAELARLAELAHGALRPGGALVVETPSPLGPALADFHVDPLARRPVHPTFLRFVLEAAGFSSVEARFPGPGPRAEWPAVTSATAAEKASLYCVVAVR